MIKSYLTIAYRNLWKYKFYTLTNVIGLSIGFAASLLITLYVIDELSYDRFHGNADSIYRVTTKFNFNGTISQCASTNYHIAEVIDVEIPEIQTTLRVQKMWDHTIRQHDRLFPGIETIAVDSNFFNFFTFPLIEGNPNTALDDPNSIVLTEKLAILLFNKTEGILGKTIEMDGIIYQVTGVAGNPPSNAHFHFELIKQFEPRTRQVVNWGDVNGTVSTYFLLADNSSAIDIPQKIKEVCLKYNPNIEEWIDLQKFDVDFFAQPLKDIHLHSQMEMELEANSDIKYVYTFSIIALLIIIIASINYVNMSTARSSNRAREVGVRKTMGSGQGLLINQFLTESILVSVIAALLGLGLAELFRHPFNQLANKQLSLNLLEHPITGMLVLMAGVGIGILAGLYPAFYLTRFRPVQALRGKFKTGGAGKNFRNALVIFQFSVSIALIVCTMVVYYQLQFVQSKNLGYNHENVVLLNNAMKNHYEAFVNEVKRYPKVKNIAASSQSPHLITNSQGGLLVRGQEENELFELNRLLVDYEFLPTFDIPLKLGRNFSPEFANDTLAMILNVAATKKLNIEAPLQAQIQRNNQNYQVIGVVEDFHFQSLHHQIAPLFILLGTSAYDYNNIEVRISEDDVPGTIAFLEKTWKKFAPNSPFYFSFLDQNYQSLYQSEMRLGKIYGIFTGLAILVACLGLVSLVAFLAEQRTKEIGIRKVLGASITSVVTLLSGDFIRLVLIAMLIATPSAWYVMNKWLQGFVYRVELQWWMFAIAGLTAILVAALTVSGQSLKAAMADPVKSLRSE